MACSIEGECWLSEPYWPLAEYFFVMSSTWSNELFHTKTRVFTLGRNASLAFPELTVPPDTQGSWFSTSCSQGGGFVGDVMVSKRFPIRLSFS